MKKDNRIIDYLLNTKEPYTIKIDGMNIEMIYSENNKNFDECILNILKQKIGHITR